MTEARTVSLSVECIFKRCLFTQFVEPFPLVLNLRCAALLVFHFLDRRQWCSVCMFLFYRKQLAIWRPLSFMQVASLWKLFINIYKKAGVFELSEEKWPKCNVYFVNCVETGTVRFRACGVGNSLVITCHYGFVCVCVCVCVCGCVCIYIYIYVCVYMYIYVCICLCVYIYIYMYMYIRSTYSWCF